jgi:carbon monoxide dehydrogenase subunit G
MELEHSFSVPVPEERAWDVLLDVERVAPCMPGATIQSVDGDDIHGSIKVKVGPITMTYQGTAHFTERDPAAHVITLEASGKETRGAGTASAKVRSMLEGEGKSTHVVVHTTLNVTGKPAQFGRGVMNEVGGKLIGIFADNLAAMIAAEQAVGGGPADEEPADTGDIGGNATESGSSSSDELLPIDVLNLPTRAWSSLRRDGIQTLGDLIRRTPEQLLAIGNIGPAYMAEINRKLADRGLELAGGAVGGQAASPADTTASASPAEHAAANGGRGTVAAPGEDVAPREPVGWQPQDEAIDLLGVAGLPVLKRAIPAVAGLLALLAIVFGFRRRGRSRRG